MKAKAELPAAVEDDVVLSFSEWIAVNGISPATGRRVLKSGACEFVQLSARRIGVTIGANRRYQQRGSK
jgi:hypothetical protein